MELPLSISAIVVTREQNERERFLMGEPARRREDRTLHAPNAGGNVWPGQHCPAFAARGGAAEETCWYCVYADFHLDKPRALDVGVCYWPKKILMETAADRS